MRQHALFDAKGQGGIARLRLHFAVLVIALAIAAVAGLPGARPAEQFESRFGGEESLAGSLRTASQNALRGRSQQSSVAATPSLNASQSERASIAEPVGPLNLATQTAAADCPAAHPAYCVYTVRAGDTLSEIAQRFNLGNAEVSGAELLMASNKPDITSVEDFIQPDQKLRIPTRRGVVQTVILGETVGDLAVLYDVSSADIVAANSLTNANLVQIGQTLLIPNPKRVTTPEQASGSAAGIPPQPIAPRFAFAWPLNTNVGRITNYFTPRHPLGIDVGMAREPQAPVYAVEAGTVAFAGGDSCCSYGLYVIIDHGNGLKTLYAHLRQISVAKGQTVTKGTQLGVTGSTGYSTGPHLHFEVHQDGKRVDPMRFLP